MLRLHPMRPTAHHSRGDGGKPGDDGCRGQATARAVPQGHVLPRREVAEQGASADGIPSLSPPLAHSFSPTTCFSWRFTPHDLQTRPTRVPCSGFRSSLSPAKTATVSLAPHFAHTTNAMARLNTHSAPNRDRHGRGHIHLRAHVPRDQLGHCRLCPRLRVSARLSPTHTHTLRSRHILCGVSISIVPRVLSCVSSPSNGRQKSNHKVAEVPLVR
jgi:hypothetical protein